MKNKKTLALKNIVSTLCTMSQIAKAMPKKNLKSKLYFSKMKK